MPDPDPEPGTRTDHPFLEGWAAPQPKLLLAIFAVLGLAISSLGWWAYLTEAERLRQRQYQELQAVGDFKATQIADWLAERRWDAESLGASRHFRQEMQLWLSSAAPLLKERIESRLQALRINDNYVGVELLDADGRPRLAIGAIRQAAGEGRPDWLGRMRGASELQALDLHRDPSSGSIELSYLLPLVASTGAQPFGYLRLSIDPDQNLYRLVRSWPTPSGSAEALLVRREGDEVLYLNDLRHIADTALNFRRPVALDELPAARAVRGEYGIFEGIDYRGVEVLSYLRGIPGTSWRLVTKVDREEVFAGIAHTARMAALGVATLVLLAGLLLWSLWRRQELRARLGLERGLARIAELSPGVIHAFALRADGSVHIPYANPVIREVYGFSPEQLGRDAGCILARIHPVDVADVRAAMRESARSGEVWLQEFRYRHPERGEVWVEVKLFPKLLAGGLVTWYGVLHDITESKRSEETLRRRNEELEALMEGLPLPVFIAHDRECRVITGNRAVNEMFGVSSGSNVSLSAEEVMADPPFRIFDAPDGRELAAAELPLQKAAQSGRSVSDMYLYFLRPDGSGLWLLGHAVPLFDTRGEVRGAVGAFIDITVRKQAEQALAAHKQRLEDEVAARTAELLRANAHLQAFTYAASHDLKSPLRGINSFSALLERNYRDRLDGDGLMFLDYIRKNAIRMTLLIDDLLAHAQLEQQTLVAKPVDLAVALGAVLDEREEEIRQRHAEIRIDLPAVSVLADPQGLLQVLRNLVENALKYSGSQASPLIEIGADLDAGCCRLWIRDNGIGFDMAYSDTIFQIFRRLHTYDEYPGSGVGLALVKKAMERMGGKVWAESAPGAGATFHLELPV